MRTQDTGSDLWDQHWGRGDSTALCSAKATTKDSSWPWCWWCSWDPPERENPGSLRRTLKKKNTLWIWCTQQVHSSKWNTLSTNSHRPWLNFSVTQGRFLEKKWQQSEHTTKWQMGEATCGLAPRDKQYNLIHLYQLLQYLWAGTRKLLLLTECLF